MPRDEESAGMAATSGAARDNSDANHLRGPRHMGRLTTHVLDTVRGKPAAGVAIELHRCDAGGAPQLLRSVCTNADGRCDAPLLEGADFRAGRYSLSFHIADYFRQAGIPMDDPPFLENIVIHFGIAEAAVHYHVPLLASPWSYATYRGS